LFAGAAGHRRPPTLNAHVINTIDNNEGLVAGHTRFQSLAIKALCHARGAIWPPDKTIILMRSNSQVERLAAYCKAQTEGRIDGHVVWEAVFSDTAVAQKTRVTALSHKVCKKLQFTARGNNKGHFAVQRTIN
jgi:hypothetical protein